MSTTEIHNQIPTTPPATTPRWSPGRVIMLSLAAFLMLGAAGSFAGAAWLGSVDDDRRDGDYLTSDTRELTTDGHALVMEEIDLDGLSGDWILGDARLRVTSADPDASVFVGIARTADAEDYLDDVQHSTVTDVDDGHAEYDEHAGGAPSADPADLDIWVAQAGGTGTQSVEWTPEEGRWTAVIMDAGGASGVDVQADVGVTVPVLEGVTTGLWIGGAVLALGAAALATAGLVRRRR